MAALPVHAADCRARSGGRVLPLVELYTAEGCSDCPPADRWLSELATGTPPEQAALLAFHVDYWDKEGWPDRFGNPRNSQRQDLRITLAGRRVTYTPQVMLGREVQVKWRDRARFQSQLQAARTPEAGATLTMQVAPGERVLEVSVAAERADAVAGPALVWLALYQDGLVSQIAEGENKGKTLHHDRVVRALAGPWRLDGPSLQEHARIDMPADADWSKMGLVLFAETARTGEGLQALALPLPQCRASEG